MSSVKPSRTALTAAPFLISVTSGLYLPAGPVQPSSRMKLPARILGPLAGVAVRVELVFFADGNPPLALPPSSRLERARSEGRFTMRPADNPQPRLYTRKLRCYAQ